MDFTRRSLLRLGAVSLASASSSAWAHKLGLLLPGGTGPANDSVLVLVEGPWLYTQPVTGMLRCISLPDPHICQMGLWNNELKTLVSPYDPSKDGPLLAGGATVKAKLNSSNKRPDVVTVFDAAFYRDDIGGPDNFVYIRNQGLKATAQSGDRTLSIAVPDNVYVAGRLTEGILHDASDPKIIVNPDSARIFVTYIFEYTQDSTGSTSLVFDDGSGKTFTLTKGQHLIFQMQTAEATAADVSHITHAFSDLVSRIGDGTVPLSVSFPEQVETASVQMGINSMGLGPDELGLQLNINGKDHKGEHKKHKAPPRKHRVGTNKQPSCAGGGIPILP